MALQEARGLSFKGFFVQTRIRELLDIVDSYPGTPSEDVIQALAEEFRDTPEYIRLCFETRIWREKRRRHKEESKRWRPRHWPEEADQYIRDHYQTATDKEIAQALSVAFGRNFSVEKVKAARRWLGLFKRPSGRKNVEPTASSAKDAGARV